MKPYKECPLCGKVIRDDQDMCDDCRNYADNQYNIDVISNSNKQKDKTQLLKATSDEVESKKMNLKNEEPVDNENKEKRKKSKTILFFLIGCFIVVVLGIWSVFNVANEKEKGETEEMYWMLCLEENSSFAYSKYLVRFPDGKYEAIANKRITELKEKETIGWKKLKQSSDVNDYLIFITNHPNTFYLDSIKIRMDSLAWAKTVEEATSDSYKAYLDNVELNNYLGNYREHAQKQYDYLSKLTLLTDDSKTLDTLKIEIYRFYKALSTLNNKDASLYLDSSIVYFGEKLSSQNLIDSLRQRNKRAGIEVLNYIPKDSTIRAFKDLSGNFLVTLVVENSYKQKEPDKTNKRRINIVTVSSNDTIEMKLDSKRKIELIGLRNN